MNEQQILQRQGKLSISLIFDLKSDHILKQICNKILAFLYFLNSKVNHLFETLCSLLVEQTIQKFVNFSEKKF